MATLPTKRDELVSWCLTHAAVWATAPTSIGLTAAQVTAFKNIAENGSNDLLAQESARSAALAATKTVEGSIADLREEASDLIQAIRSYAANTGNTNVYQIAQIPPPAAPGPVPPPGPPNDFRTTINPGGSLTLAWKCKNPPSANVIYKVMRQLPTEGAFTLLDVTGEKLYTDETLPYGVDQVSYIVTAQRGGTLGQPSQELTVRFGSVEGAGGDRTVRATTTKAAPNGVLEFNKPSAAPKKSTKKAA